MFSCRNVWQLLNTSFFYHQWNNQPLSDAEVKPERIVASSINAFKKGKYPISSMIANIIWMEPLIQVVEADLPY